MKINDKKGLISFTILIIAIVIASIYGYQKGQQNKQSVLQRGQQVTMYEKETWVP